MTDLPQAAVDAAKAALLGRYDVPNEQLDEAWLTRDAQVALTAAAPIIAAAERERIVRLAQEHGASYWRKVMSSDDPPQQYTAEFPFEDLLRAEA